MSEFNAHLVRELRLIADLIERDRPYLADRLREDADAIEQRFETLEAVQKAAEAVLSA